MNVTSEQAATANGKWLDVEPITPALESDLLQSGVDPSSITLLKDQQSVYCRAAHFFFPPVDLSHTCETKCLHGGDFDDFVKCQSCLIWVSSNGFISAVKMDDDGAYTAVKYHSAKSDR